MHTVNRLLIVASALSLTGLPLVGYAGWRTMTDHHAAAMQLEKTKDLVWRYQVAGRETALMFWRATALKTEAQVAQYRAAAQNRHELAEEMIGLGRALGFSVETYAFEQTLHEARMLLGPVQSKLEAGDFKAALAASPERDPAVKASNRRLREATDRFRF
jgi:hypothetical protein